MSHYFWKCPHFFKGDGTLPGDIVPNFEISWQNTVCACSCMLLSIKVTAPLKASESDMQAFIKSCNLPQTRSKCDTK